MSAKISAIILFYNGAAYLPECVTSVLNQTYANLEVILVDDGSTDASSRQAEEFRQRDQRVRILHKANGGPGDSRNAGLAMATGEYVAFVDHDDRLEPTSFAQLMALQERTQDEIVMANFFFHVEGEAGFQVAFSKDDYFEQVYTPTEWLAMEYKRDFGISECFSAPWGKLYRRQLWDDVAFPVDQVAEDDFTTWRVYLGAERLAFMNAGLYMYRQRPDSLSARQNSTKIFTLPAVEKWIATLALLGLDVAPEIEAYRLRLLSHRSKMELHDAQDVVTYKTVCHTLKMLDKYCPGVKS